jgi:hypothetical protein
MHLIIINWAYQDMTKAATDMLETEGSWSSADLPKFEKGKTKGKAIWEFFRDRGLTPLQVRAMLPEAIVRLRDEAVDDRRLHTPKGWQDTDVQVLPLSAAGLQPLADHLGMPVVMLYTVDKYPRIPTFCCEVKPQRN